MPLRFTILAGRRSSDVTLPSPSCAFGSFILNLDNQSAQLFTALIIASWSDCQAIPTLWDQLQASDLQHVIPWLVTSAMALRSGAPVFPIRRSKISAAGPIAVRDSRRIPQYL